MYTHLDIKNYLQGLNFSNQMLKTTDHWLRGYHFISSPDMRHCLLSRSVPPLKFDQLKALAWYLKFTI